MLTKAKAAGHGRDMDRNGLINAWMKDTDQTFAGFVRAVCEKAAEQGEASLRGKERSLYVQLGRWRDGANNLDDRPDAAVLQQALAEVLDQDVSLLFERRAKGDAATFPMEGFEELGPFDPRSESPCLESPLIQLPDGVLDDGLRPRHRPDWLHPRHSGAMWVHAPAGSGRSFVSHWHRYHWRNHTWDLNDPSRPAPAVFVVERFEELAQVSWPPEWQLMVVEVQRADGDLRVLGRLAQRVAMVVAPFPFPALESSVSARELRAGEWTQVEWAPDARWRKAFIKWAAERVQRRFSGNTLLDGDSVAQWADSVDPHCRFFNTPESLLGLVQYAHHKGERELEKHFGAPLAREWLAELLGRHRGETARDAWLRESAAQTVERMVVAWWAERQIPWNDRFDAALWERVVPDESVGAIDETREEAVQIRAKLNRKASKTERKRLEARLDELLRCPPHKSEVVRALLAARLLRPRGAGTLQIAPSWIAIALIRTHLDEEITTGSVESWGRASVDPSRQADVDAALDRLDWEATTRVTARALEATGGLGVVGAVESLFLAVGRKLRGRVAVARHFAPTLDALVRRQLELLVRRSQDGVPAPRTRGGLHEPAQGGARFISACWEWSFARPPCREVEESLAWLFPGWAAPSMALCPRALGFHDGSFARGPFADAERDGAQRLAELSPRVLARCGGEFAEPSGELPSFLVAAAPALAMSQGWSMALVLRGLKRATGIHDLAARWIREMPDEERAATIDAMWEALLAQDAGAEELLRAFEPAGGNTAFREKYFQRTRAPAPLEAVMMSRLPVEALVTKIAADSSWNDERISRLFVRAPEGARVRFARPLLDQSRRPGTGPSLMLALARAALAHPDEMFDVLVEMADNPRIAHDVVATLWSQRPNLVLQHALDAWRERGTTHPWISNMPAGRLAAVLSVFEAVPEQPLGSELLAWLSRTLPDAGPLADRLWALLEREEWVGLR